MKLASYEYQERGSYGVVTDAGIADVPSAWPDGPADLLEALRRGPEALEGLRKLPEAGQSPLRLEDVHLLPPLPAPPKVIGLAGNYAAHIREARLAAGLSDDPHADTVPRPFLMPVTAVAGPGTLVPWPIYSEQIDYEVELAVVIGAPAKCISPQQARGCIAGYAIANDGSARSVTFAAGRAERPRDDFFDWLNGKWADGFCVTGPWLVTADEFGEPTDQTMELRVNDELRQHATPAEMIFDVFEVVSFLSHLMTLLPGDLIATGTPAGVGAADGRFLRAGDRVSSAIDGIGELTFTLGRRPEQFYRPCQTD